MVNKKALIAEIELFGKLDVKYVLEALRDSSSAEIVYGDINIFNTPIVLNDDDLEFIKECLSLLVELDNDFSLAFQKALVQVDIHNKIANIEIQSNEIPQKDINLLYALLQNQPKGSKTKKLIDAFIEKFNIFEEISLADDFYNINFSLDTVYESMKYDKNIDNFDRVLVPKMSETRDNRVDIGGDNSGTIITGDGNTVVNHTEIDFNKKLEEELAKLTIGNLIFNTPEEMFVDETREVTLRISKDIILVNDLPKENQTIQQEIKISQFMKAVLKSHDFDIMALNSEEQIIDSSTATEWKWDITPKVPKAGAKIYLTVTVRIPLSDNKEVKKDIPVFKRNINILLK